MPDKKTKHEVSEDEQTDVVDAPADLVEIPFNGTIFVVDRNRDNWSTLGLSYLTEAKYNLFVKHTLDIAKSGQWNTLVQLCPRRRDFNEFFEVFGKIVNSECVG